MNEVLGTQNPLVLFGSSAHMYLLGQADDDAIIRIKIVKKKTGFKVLSVLAIDKSEPRAPRVLVDAKPPTELRVKFFDRNKGYGFFEGTPEGSDVFVHLTVVEQSDISADEMLDGASFVVQYSTKTDGKLCATHIKRTGT